MVSRNGESYRPHLAKNFPAGCLVWGIRFPPFNSAGGREAASVSPFPPPSPAPWRVSLCGKVEVEREGTTRTGTGGTGASPGRAEA